MIRLAMMAAAAALLGSAGASAAAQSDQRPRSSEEGSVYGRFLAGRVAMGLGATDDAAGYLRAAAETNPELELLRERAFVSSLLSGDITTAAAYAPREARGLSSLYGLGQLTLATESIASGRSRAALDILSDEIAFPHALAGGLLKPWAQASAGDLAGASAALSGEQDRVLQLFGAIGRAKLLEMRGRYGEAEDLYKASLADPVGSALFVRPYGEFLERRRRRAEALAIYDQALAAGELDPGVTAARDRAASGGRPPAAPTVRQGAAQALTFAAAYMTAERQNELALAYLRLALRLDPAHDQAWVWVGDAMERSEDPVGARQAWSRVLPTSPHWSEARTRMAWSLQSAGAGAEALSVARAGAAARPGDLGMSLTLIDILRAQESFEEAAALLKPLADGAFKDDWRVQFMAGTVLDKTDSWQAAEGHLLRALELRPDDPDIQNYLGYSWIDRGERIDEGMALVEKALVVRPNSGAYIDSLAWGHFRKGEHQRAVEMLEQAVLLEPADPEINDHLGDAYWMVGRKREAEFQWRRVLTLDPPESRRRSVESKLSGGLPVRAQVAQR